MAQNEISWPDKYRPEESAVHVVNKLLMDAPSETVWNRLVRVTEWPDWYPNASNVRLLETEGEMLEFGTRFRWKTFGTTIECRIAEFQPPERLAWSSESAGMSVYHAWLISPQPHGCHVLTEETQNGFIPKIAKIIMPGRIHKFHQIWLEQLNEISREDSIAVRS